MLHRHLRHWPLWIACGLVIALALWARPRRIDALATLDGQHRWLVDARTPTREFAWQPAEELADLLPPRDPPDEVSDPCLADDGILYLTVHRPQGDADIYRSRWLDGRWQPAEAVTELNTPWDEEAAAVSGDGRQLYLASNRRGGTGGFDLYVSQRRPSGWGVPKNLGNTVNTAANEYDPALGTDGLQLYFASDREAKNQTTDLYIARRAATNERWSDITAIARANSTAQERSPRLVDGGTVLYFASDRPNGNGGFDLYRLRLADSNAAAENLGRGVNTEADETDPAISDDGFRLMFARREGATPTLYRSRLAEVERTAIWDTSRWQALRAVWWKAILATALFGGLAAFVYYCGGWLRRRASMARFLAASLLLHVAVLWLMILVPLSQEIAKRMEEIRVTDAAAQLVDDNLHQSHSPGEQPYEKVADLKSVEAVQVPQTARQVTALTNVPLHAESPAPTLPLELARRLPADRLIFVPPPNQAPKLNREIERSAVTALRVAQIESLSAEPPPNVAAVQEQPVEKKEVESTRAAAGIIVPREPVDVNRPLVDPAIESPELEPVHIEPATRATSVADIIPPRVARSIAPAEMDQETIPLAPVDKMPERPIFEREQSEVTLAVKEALPLQPSTTESSPSTPPITVAAQAIERQISLPQSATPLNAELTRVTTLPHAAAALPDEDPMAVARVEALREAAISPAMIAVEPAVPKMPRLDNDALIAGGPRQAGKQQLVVGTLADKAVDAPPSANPLATQLQRAAARATPVVVAEDNVGMQAMFALRQGDTRREFIDLVGGNAETEAAVTRGLRWLSEHQHADGRWSLHQLDPPEKKLAATSGAGNIASDTAATGLGLLPFLGSGHTHLAGDYKPIVGKAIEWLVGRQKPDGNLFADPPSNAFMYSHGIAAIALCEAYGMSQDERLREPAQRALNFIVAAQHQGTGGWRYQPGESGDTSVVGWQVMALKSGEMAGLAVPKAALDLASKWLTSAAGTGGALGTFGYQGPGGNPAMTAEGLLCRQFLGSRRNDPALLAGANYLVQHLPQAGQETTYYWYYATQVLYHMQGNYWTAWNERLRGLLISSQIKDGHQAGTWDPRDHWEQSGGRLYATSLRLLMLEVYYRHLPLYQQFE